MKVHVKSGGIRELAIQMSPDLLTAIHLTISGRVQGVGFRPFVSSLAKQLNLLGWVRNDGSLVDIWVEGDLNNIAIFKEHLLSKKPSNAHIKHIKSELTLAENYADFSILESINNVLSNAHIPPDYSICEACLIELNTPDNSRYQYPFINCTQCGPRYTIMTGLPYDRRSTSMVDFIMCDRCKTEYQNPVDRRYHAQSLSCPECGPTLSFTQGNISTNDVTAALTSAIDVLKNGHILAIKGIGGYHLCCLATSEIAVNNLRKNKHRNLKPFAVMLANIKALIQHAATPSEAELMLLQANHRPIVLIGKNRNSTITNTVAPGLKEVGFLLPYTPLQHLILQGVDQALVITSANISGEGILLDNTEVETKMAHIAEAFLHHDINILRAAEDSVYRVINNIPQILRFGRGIAPLELALPITLKHPLIALGGQFKNTIALAWDDRIVISPHIGDLSSPRSMQVFEDTISQFCLLYGVTPTEYICDAHPEYNAHRWAVAQNINVTKVFHHYAHASALYTEHKLTEATLIFTWDGTGYGEDATLWGGEGVYGKPGDWQRVSSIKPFKLIGGDKSTTEPWRTALSVCWETEETWHECPYDTTLLNQAWTKQFNCTTTTSIGRLFDAAAALTLQVYKSDFDGHAPMWLESIANKKLGATIDLPLNYNENGLWISDWSPLITMLLNTESSPEEKSSSFHSSLAMILVKQAKQIHKTKKFKTVGLCGGVFQNRLLTEQAFKLLTAEGFKVILPKLIPSNDAGLSYGQIIEADTGRQKKYHSNTI